MADGDEATVNPSAELREEALSSAGVRTDGTAPVRVFRTQTSQVGFDLKNPNLPMMNLAPAEAHNRLVGRWAAQSLEATLMATINISLAFGSELINVEAEFGHWWLKPLFITLSVAAFAANVSTAGCITQLTADIGRIEDARMGQCIKDYGSV